MCYISSNLLQFWMILKNLVVLFSLSLLLDWIRESLLILYYNLVQRKLDSQKLCFSLWFVNIIMLFCGILFRDEIALRLVWFLIWNWNVLFLLASSLYVGGTHITLIKATCRSLWSICIYLQKCLRYMLESLSLRDI